MFFIRRSTPMSDRLWSRLDTAGPYGPLVLLFMIGLPLLSASRIALVLWQADRVEATGAWLDILVQGVRVDVIQLSLLAAPLVVLAPLLATRPFWPVWRRLSAVWVMLAVGVLVLLEVSTPAFITEYDSRPNRTFVEYLKYPRELSSMLLIGFRVHLVAGLGTVALAVFATRRMLGPWLTRTTPWSHAGCG